MSEKRNLKKIYQSEQHDPINYTCGICRRVHKFDSKLPYVCENVVVDSMIGEEN